MEVSFLSHVKSDLMPLLVLSKRSELVRCAWMMWQKRSFLPTSIPRKKLGRLLGLVVVFMSLMVVPDGRPKHLLAEESQSHQNRFVMI